ncbi:MAG: hypothetical protein HDQ88_10605 [Clostridia bacterium]|nr:hypothetical protein [Clostridia bacterium]
MVKIRLWGLPDEIKAVSDFLKAQPQVRITYRSSERNDRGESEYKRIYIEAELTETKEQK